MKRQLILVWIVVMTAGTSVYSADWQLDWVGGDYIPPTWSWSIYPYHFPPFPPGRIPFSGPTGVFSNDCFAQAGLGGTPTITIDPNQKTIELWFQPPAPTVCLMYWDPVCGLNGWFGPLSEGDWLFYSNQIPSPYGSFYINIHIDGPPMLTILNPNGNERLLGGSTYTIRWEDSRSEGCGGNYLLDYSIDNGNSWIPVDSNPISNTCFYDWLVPSIFSNQCLIRISTAGGYPYIRDKSDDSFRIYVCMSNVLGDWNGDCYVDFGDFSIIAAGWNVPGGTDMNDLATLVQYWLDCANPYDPSCSFGEAMPDFPADGAVIPGYEVTYLGDEYIWTKLIFFPGATAVEHTGYFNEDYSKVESRHQDANLGSPPYAYVSGWEYTLFAGNPQVPPANQTLVRDQKYYWTVDAEDALGNTFPGEIWEFTILDFYAFAPSPPNEAVDVETTVLLSWLPGIEVWDHDVYMGTSWEDVNNARYTYPLPPEFLATRSEPNIVVTSLALNTTYYWRVDEVYFRDPIWVDTVYKGRVWEFTTISVSAEPNFPADGEVIDGQEVQYLGDDYIWTKLIFIPGATAVEHTGYFHEDYSKVESRHQDANLGPPPYAYVSGWEYTLFAGNPQVLPANQTLVRGTKYYWTVDATDALGNTFSGEIWEFTILGFYASEPDPPNEATLVETDVLLSWQPGYNPTGIDYSQHDVYMGTSWEDVNNAVYSFFPPDPPELLATVSEPNIAVTSLELNTTYYWRVDEFLWLPPPGGGLQYLYKGDVWEFTTTPSALNNIGSINFIDYAIPSNYRQKTGPILPAHSHKEDLVDYKDLRILIPPPAIIEPKRLNK